MESEDELSEEEKGRYFELRSPIVPIGGVVLVELPDDIKNDDEIALSEMPIKFIDSGSKAEDLFVPVIGDATIEEGINVGVVFNPDEDIHLDHKNDPDVDDGFGSGSI